MPRVRPLEVRALTPLLEQNWDTPEDLAEALILALDQVRADRTSYIAVMQFGTERPVIYLGLGPYPGYKSAENAVKSFPGATLATRCAIVPLMSPEGLMNKLKEVG